MAAVMVPAAVSASSGRSGGGDDHDDDEARIRVKDDEFRVEVKKDNDGLFNDFDVKKEFRVKVDNDGEIRVRNELNRDFDFNGHN